MKEELKGFEFPSSRSARSLMMMMVMLMMLMLRWYPPSLPPSLSPISSPPLSSSLAGLLIPRLVKRKRRREGWRGGGGGEVMLGGREREAERHMGNMRTPPLPHREVFPASVGDGLVADITLCVCLNLIHKNRRRRRKKRG